jgi:hypothetical protein
MKMASRSKLYLAMLVASVMTWLNVLSHPLGIPFGVQLALEIGVFIPLGLVFVYNRRMRNERKVGEAQKTAAVEKPLRPSLRAGKGFLGIWVCAVLFSLAAPLWLPITGNDLGVRTNLLVGFITAVVVSCVFFWGLRRRAVRF